MEAYKFLTRISKNGSVKLPPTPELFDRDVEIIILPLKRETSKKLPAKKFVEKWAGTIESITKIWNNENIIVLSKADRKMY